MNIIKSRMIEEDLCISTTLSRNIQWSDSGIPEKWDNVFDFSVFVET